MPWSSTPTKPPGVAVPEARDPRLRIEHAQHVRKEDVARFARTGTIASMQPSHCSDEIRWADARLGPDRSQGAYAWRWFADGGVTLAFGSDFPVGDRQSVLRPLCRRDPPTARRQPARRLAPRPAADPRRGPPSLHRRARPTRASPRTGSGC